MLKVEVVAELMA